MTLYRLHVMIIKSTVHKPIQVYRIRALKPAKQRHVKWTKGGNDISWNFHMDNLCNHITYCTLLHYCNHYNYAEGL